MDVLLALRITVGLQDNVDLYVLQASILTKKCVLLVMHVVNNVQLQLVKYATLIIIWLHKRWIPNASPYHTSIIRVLKQNRNATLIATLAPIVVLVLAFSAINSEEMPLKWLKVDTVTVGKTVSISETGTAALLIMRNSRPTQRLWNRFLTQPPTLQASVQSSVPTSSVEDCSCSISKATLITTSSTVLLFYKLISSWRKL